MMNIKKILDLTDPKISDCILRIKNEILGDEGRIIVRKSGTEPITRVMIESSSEDDMKSAIEYFQKVVR